MALNDTLGVKIKADAKELDNISKGAKKTGKSLDAAGKKGSKSFNKLDNVLKSVEKNLARQAKRMAVAGVVGVGALGTLALKTAIDFEDSFAGVRKTVDATEEQFQQLAQGMRNLAKEIPVNVNELNKIGEAAGQLGIKTENIEEFTEVIAKLGVTTNLTTDEAATQLARFANITGLSQEKFSNLASSLVDLGNNFATTEAEISAMSLRLAGAGTQIGLSEQEILALATSLSSVGLRAESAGTAFSKLFIGIAGEIANNGDNLQTFAAIAGQTVEQFSHQFETDAVGAIQAFIKGLGEAEERGSDTLVLLEELGISEVRFRDALLRSSNAFGLMEEAVVKSNKAFDENSALTEEAEKKFATTASKLKLLKQNIQDVFITIGNGLKPAIDAIIPVVQQMAVDVGEWIEENDELLKQDIMSMVNTLKEALPGLIDLMKGAGEAAKIFGQGIALLTEKSKNLGDFINQHDIIFVGGFPVLRKNANVGREETQQIIEDGQEYNKQLDAIIEAQEALEKSQERQSKGYSESSNSLNGLTRAIEDSNGTLFDWRNTITETTDKTEDIKKVADETKNLINLPQGGGSGGGGGKDTKTALEELNEEIEKNIASLKKEMAEMGKTIKQRIAMKAAIDLEKGALKSLVAERARLESIKADNDFLQGLDDEIEALKEEKRELTATAEELRNFAVSQLIVNAALETTTQEGFAEAIKKIQEYKELIEDIDLIKFTQEHAGEAFESLEKDFGLIVENAEDATDSLEEFIGNVADSINNNLSDALFNVSKEGFGGMKDAALNALDSIKRAFFDLIASFITNPIRIALDASLSGGGSGNIAKDVGGGIFGAIGGLFDGSGLGGLFKEGGLLGGIGNLFRDGGALSFIGSALSFVQPIIGAVATLFTFVAPLLEDLFKKKPRLDLDFDKFRDNAGKAIEGIEGIVQVEDFLSDELFDQIFNVSVKRKAGLGVGGDEGIKKLVRDRIRDSIQAVQDIIAKLPDTMFDQLNELLLNATLDTETVISGGGKGERFFEFDAEGKNGNVAKAFKDFIEKELPAKFFGAIRESFFQPALESLGVASEGAQDLIDKFLEDLDNAGSREARGEIGQEFLEQFNAFVDAFNFAEGNFVGSGDHIIGEIKRLSEELGFKGIPTLGEMREEMARLIEAAEIDPEVVQRFQDLRAAIVGMVQDLAASITGIVSQINSLNSTFNFGINTDSQVRHTRDQLLAFLQENEDSLSPQEKTALLQQIQQLNDILAQSQIAQGQADSQAQQAQAQAQAEQERARLNGLIDQQRELRDLTEETFDARLETLQAELEAAQIMERLNQRLIEDRRSLLTSASSPLSNTEQLAFVNNQIAGLEGQLSGASPQETESIINQIRDLQAEALGLAGEIFGIGSAEQIAIFTEQLAKLDALIELTGVSGRTAEEIQLDIEALNQERNEILAEIDANISDLQNQLSNVVVETGNAQVSATENLSQDVIDVGEFLAEQWLQLLDDQLENLDEIIGDPQLQLVNITEDLLITTRSHRDKTIEGFNTLIRALRPGKADGGAQLEFAHGGLVAEEVRGIGSSGRSFTFGENGAEVVLGLEKIRALRRAVSEFGGSIEGIRNRKFGGGSGVIKDIVEIVLRFDGDFTEETRRWIEREITEGGLGRVIIRRVETGFNRKKVA